MPNEKTNNLFISFEGIEGSGKTTQINFIKDYFESQGYEVLCLREPGGTDFGEILRDAILQSKEQLAPIAEAYLFASSRAQLLKEKVIPFLERPKTVVIVDRFIDSSIAYQGVARELGMQTILDIHTHSPLDLRPTLTFYLEIDLQTSFERQSSRGNEKDYFESEKAQFYEKLIKGYELCYKSFPERVIKIDGKQDQKTISEQINKTLIEAMN